MKHLLIILAIVLASQARADEPNWEFMAVNLNYFSGWNSKKGMASVEISEGKITIKGYGYFEDESGKLTLLKFPLHTIRGTISKDGTILAQHTLEHSNAPDIEVTGKYRKGTSSETIILENGANIYAVSLIHK